MKLISTILLLLLTCFSTKADDRYVVVFKAGMSDRSFLPIFYASSSRPDLEKRGLFHKVAPVLMDSIVLFNQNHKPKLGRRDCGMDICFQMSTKIGTYTQDSSVLITASENTTFFTGLKSLFLNAGDSIGAEYLLSVIGISDWKNMPKR